MAFPAGRHFLQIPGPTNVPDRVLRAIDRPTIDHRGRRVGAAKASYSAFPAAWCSLRMAMHCV